MQIQAFPSGPFSTNTYVASCPETYEATIIDAAPDSADAVLKYLADQQLTCSKILLTHSHWDHIADVQPLKEALQAQVYIHPLDIPNLKEPGTDGLPFWIPISPVSPDVQLKEGDSIQVGKQILQVIHTPGHTPGGLCFFHPKAYILFSGDTLFKGSIGNLSFPTSLPDQMWLSLEKLAHLPHQTKVYPGHGSFTTIGNESWLPRARELFS